MSKIETELQALTKVKRKAKEADQSYFKRLVETTLDEEVVDEKKWEEVSGPAQRWVNAGAKAIKADKDIASFPDAEDEDSKASKDGKGAKASTAAPKTAAAKKPKDDRIPVSVRIKQMLIDDLTVLAGDIFKALVKEGYSPSLSSCTTIRSDFLHSIKVLKEAGKIKGL